MTTEDATKIVREMMDPRDRFTLKVEFKKGDPRFRGVFARDSHMIVIENTFPPSQPMLMAGSVDHYPTYGDPAGLRVLVAHMIDSVRREAAARVVEEAERKTTAPRTCSGGGER